MARKTKAELARIAAAKKGWETRRKNAKKAARAAKAPKRKPVKAKISTSTNRTKRALSTAAKKGWETRRKNKIVKLQALGPSPEVLAVLRKNPALFAQAIYEASELSATDPEYFRNWKSIGEDITTKRNGYLAGTPSEIRRADRELQDRVLERLRVAELEGNLDLEVIELAELTGYSERDIYTLWFSP